MLKELSTFTQSLDADLKEIGVEPREGLHIVLSLEESPEAKLRITDTFDYVLVRKNKKTELQEPLTNCAAWARAAWMVDEDTNKCIDKTTKAIHSCSPFCLAIKRQNLQGGKKMMERQEEGKSIVYGSLKDYFDKAIEFTDEYQKNQAKLFIEALNSAAKIHDFLNRIDNEEENKVLHDNKYQSAGYKQLKEGEYVIFYLNLPLPVFKKAYDKYLFDKVFSVNSYNTPKGPITKETKGLSAFFNGLPDKKPFLSHKTAPFDISGRITAEDALSLVEFKQIAARRILPNPLPIFIFSDELPKVNLRNKVFSIFKEEAQKDPDKRKTHAQIITELYDRYRDELGNYYLLYYQQGQIKDFDFVSKFEYHLTDVQGNPWTVTDWFNVGYAPLLADVFTFQNTVLPLIFNNALVVRTKVKKGETEGGILLKFFDDIDPQHCRPSDIYLLIMRYRQAFYDFIYKSKRQAVTQQIFEDILLTGILGNLRLDKHENRQHSEDANIRRKLNLLFSLHTYFQPYQTNPVFMPNQLTELRPFMTQLALGEASIETDEQFAFAAGQVIRYVLSKSRSGDRSFSRLESFLQKTDTKLFQQALLKTFNTYKHERFSRKFEQPYANVMAYRVLGDLRDLMPLMLAGFFSANQLFADKQQEPEIEEFND